MGRCRYEEPAIEDLYRFEQELNRVGKTRAEGKVLPLRANVVDRIKVRPRCCPVRVTMSIVRCFIDG